MARSDPDTSSQGFPPLSGPDARILILGSLPGKRSLDAVQYYAHPQNVFWRIMRDTLGIEGDYAQRCAQLIERRVAVWDVLASSVRPGSMDADIRMETACANDFNAFFAVHTRISTVCFNGRKAQKLFAKFVAPTLAQDDQQKVLLPSTSPAYAAMSYERKLAQWRGILLA